jgi:transcriptional regulator with XRE-family HTH domain
LVADPEGIEIDFGEPLVIPDRSVLYHLKPIARGTALRESLCSFLLRLADQHTMNPSALSFVAGIDQRCCGRWARNVWTQSYFKAAGVVTRLWARELARLTAHHCLDDLTLLPLVRAVSDSGLAHKARKWCPQCLRDGEQEGVAYGQLLWEIAIVEACPVHAIRLVGTCRCGGTGVNARIAKRLPHICRSCCRSLTEVSPSTQAPLALVQRARRVADLLDDPDFDRASWPADGFSQFLLGVARLHFEGKLLRLAGYFGVDKVTVYGWAHYSRRPPLQRLVKVAEFFGCPIRSVLLGDASGTQPRTIAPLSLRRPKRRRITPELRKHIPRQLRAFQKRKKALPLNQVVRELGVSAHYLRRYYRTTCEAIVARFQQQRAAETAERRSRLIQLFRSRAEAIAASGAQLTLDRAMGPDALRLIRLRQQCHQIIAELLSQTGQSQAAAQWEGWKP